MSDIAKVAPTGTSAVAKSEAKSKMQRPIPFFPNHALTELALALVFVGAIFILAALRPKGLGDPANVLSTPEHIKPEWYFLWMFELLKLIPSKLVGLLSIAAAMLALVFVPWLERKQVRKPAERKRAFLVMGLVIAACIILSVISW